MVQVVLCVPLFPWHLLSIYVHISVDECFIIDGKCIIDTVVY